MPGCRQSIQHIIHYPRTIHSRVHLALHANLPVCRLRHPRFSCKLRRRSYPAPLRRGALSPHQPRQEPDPIPCQSPRRRAVRFLLSFCLLPSCLLPYSYILLDHLHIPKGAIHCVLFKRKSRARRSGRVRHPIERPDRAASRSARSWASTSPPLSASCPEVPSLPRTSR